MTIFKETDWFWFFFLHEHLCTLIENSVLKYLLISPCSVFTASFTLCTGSRTAALSLQPSLCCVFPRWFLSSDFMMAKTF